ncbi:MAG: glycosyltransferase family 87 protein [Terracidiphilus sp.]
MIKARLDGLYLALLGSVIFVVVGSTMENTTLVTTLDFRVVYYSARCLLDRRDPYREGELQRVYRVEGGESPYDTPGSRRVETQYLYPPTAFPFFVPFAILPFWPAHLLWLALTAVSFITASLLIWNIGADYAPVLTGGLICLILANSELFLILGNPAGIAISLCVVAAWCIVRERLAILGILCLSASLMIRPHDSSLVWLYFLLLGGTYRKRALQTLAAIVAMSLPTILWVSSVAPLWVQELHTNLVANSTHGGLSDPGPTSMAGHGLGMIISLQTIFSIFRDDPAFYNPASYLVCGGLLLILTIKTLRIEVSQKIAWLGLAPIAAISMLPIYHRIYDAKLLLLAIPACAIIWARGGALAWIAASLSGTGILSTGSFPWVIFYHLIKYLPLPPTPQSRTILVMLQVFPVPLILLTFGAFYLWVYVGRFSVDAEGAGTGESVVSREGPAML